MGRIQFFLTWINFQSKLVHFVIFGLSRMSLCTYLQMPGAKQSFTISVTGPIVPCDSGARKKIWSTKFPLALPAVGETDQSAPYYGRKGTSKGKVSFKIELINTECRTTYIFGSCLCNWDAIVALRMLYISIVSETNWWWKACLLNQTLSHPMLSCHSHSQSIMLVNSRTSNKLPSSLPSTQEALEHGQENIGAQCQLPNC